MSKRSWNSTSKSTVFHNTSANDYRPRQNNSSRNQRSEYNRNDQSKYRNFQSNHSRNNQSPTGRQIRNERRLPYGSSYSITISNTGNNNSTHHNHKRSHNEQTSYRERNVASTSRHTSNESNYGGSKSSSIHHNTLRHRGNNSNSNSSISNSTHDAHNHYTTQQHNSSSNSSNSYQSTNKHRSLETDHSTTRARTSVQSTPKQNDNQMKESWRENVPMLYEYLLERKYSISTKVFAAAWTCNDSTTNDTHRLIYGVHQVERRHPRDYGNITNYNSSHRVSGLLTLANVQLPSNAGEQWDNLHGLFMGTSSSTERIQETVSIEHPDSKLRSLVATEDGGIVTSGEDTIYHYDNLDTQTVAHCKAFKTLDCRPGPGLCVTSQYIVNGAMSGQFICYDRSQPDTPAVMSDALNENKSIIHEIDKHPGGQWFCGVTDNGQLLIWDLRQKSLGVVNTHQSVPLLTCSWNTQHVYHLLCGNADGDVLLWDMRKRSNNTMEPVKEFKYHAKAVNCVRWSPHLSNVFAAGSNDMTISLVNANKEVITCRTTLDETALIFRHFIHYTPVKQLTWHPRIPGVLASVASSNEQDSTVQVWKPNLWFLKGSAMLPI
ncbi:WD40-repeat-containing domain protein [Syncephalis plumigaleata]|nr:WD40-repeat-containing domain protein [Syncephalis plumigaleata]